MKAGLFIGIAALVGLALPVQAEDHARRDPVVVDAKTEAIIQGALKYLAANQLPSGAWGSSEEEQRYPVAITGYTLMAFQAAGQLPGEGPFGSNVAAGMQYLLDATVADGVIGNRGSGQQKLTSSEICPARTRAVVRRG